MSNKTLLDTDVIIYYTKGSEKYADFINSLGQVNVSFITIGELYRGALNKNDLRNIISLTKHFNVLPCTPKVSALSTKLLEKYALSHGLGILDAIIAGTAIKNNLILITLNIKHFQMIKELKVKKV